MHIITRIPHRRQLAKGIETLSKEARRLKILDWHRLESGKFSADGRPNASLACRRFGVHRSYFNRWLSRYREGGALEDRSRSPKNKRQPAYGTGLVAKIRVVLTWEVPAGEVPGSATIGRIIRKFNMYYRADTQR